MSVDFQLEDSSDYIYEKMADHIEARIKSGELRPGMPLPAERRLADEYGVSLGTARRATEVLRDRELVVTRRSKGTFVAKRSVSEGDRVTALQGRLPREYGPGSAQQQRSALGGVHHA